MTDELNRLVAALREELQQYGEMLALLERQQDLVMSRASSELLESVNAIQAQALVIQEARHHREDCRSTLATEIAQPASTKFEDLLPLVPDDYRPLLQALVDENNELLFRVQQRARQNHLLLSRSLDLMQRFMSTLFPSRETSVYDDRGARQGFPLPARPLYTAVG